MPVSVVSMKQMNNAGTAFLKFFEQSNLACLQSCFSPFVLSCVCNAIVYSHKMCVSTFARGCINVTFRLDLQVEMFSTVNRFLL